MILPGNKIEIKNQKLYMTYNIMTDTTNKHTVIILQAKCLSAAF